MDSLNRMRDQLTVLHLAKQREALDADARRVLLAARAARELAVQRQAAADRLAVERAQMAQREAAAIIAFEHVRAEAARIAAEHTKDAARHATEQLADDLALQAQRSIEQREIAERLRQDTLDRERREARIEEAIQCALKRIESSEKAQLVSETAAALKKKEARNTVQAAVTEAAAASSAEIQERAEAGNSALPVACESQNRPNLLAEAEDARDRSDQARLIPATVPPGKSAEHGAFASRELLIISAPQDLPTVADTLRSLDTFTAVKSDPARLRAILEAGRRSKPKPAASPARAATVGAGVPPHALLATPRNKAPTSDGPSSPRSRPAGGRGR